MNDQNPRPEIPESSAASGHDLPATFSSDSTPATPAPVVPEAPSVPAASIPERPALPTAVPQAPTFAAPDGATLPLGAAAPVAPGAAASGAAFGAAAQIPTPIESAPSAQKKSLGGTKVAAIILAAALVGGAAGVGGSALYAGLNGGSSTGPVAGPSTVTVNNPDEVTSATAIAAKALPSVVTIEVAGSSSGGSGSGVILDEQGHILTNAHVVTLDGQATEPAIRVTTSDGRLLDAEVVGIDPLYDLAVIKVSDASGLTPIEFADSSEVNVGSVAAAVGAPLGLANSVTTGIVSALNRSISVQSSALPEVQGAPDGEDSQGDQPFQFDLPGATPSQGQRESISISVIQTDAAINPGNSGGALVDGDGRLIGINVAIATASGSSDAAGSIGVGFAIPSNIAQRIADELIENGEATHGLLGASVSPASSVEDATVLGAYIANATPGGAADAAGLREGDIVTAFNGTPISNARDLTAQVRSVAAGAEAEVTFVRDGRTQTATVTLGDLNSLAE
ncbi:trypsin-like peptidase domain-containing protein [Microbacterium keratanolyticum]|uniref:S1C family serine protease n=1 Tax=Microbacterium keratanolyticum TaxID=67574 RepID=UPI003670D1DC